MSKDIPLNILAAARKGKLDVVKQLVWNEGISTDFQLKEDGNTPLMEAAAGGCIEVIRFLLNPGRNHAPADVNKQDSRDLHTALTKAALHDKLDCIALLLEHGAKPLLQTRNGWTILYIAANRGNVAVVNFILERISSKTCIETKSTAGATALMIASSQGHCEVVKALVASGADVNSLDKQDGSVLMRAAEKGHTRIVEFLLERGAQLELKDKQGCTAMIRAADNQYADVVQSLVRGGACVSTANNDEYGALHVASREGRTDTVDVLLDSKEDTNLDIDAVTTNQETALLLAVKNDQYKVARSLWRNGADIFTVNKDGASALTFARSPEMVDLLFHQSQPAPPQNAPPPPTTPMIIIECADIPRYLHSSDLSKALRENGGSFPILSMYYKKNDKVADLADFKQLLRATEFWRLPRLPAGLCHYCLQNDVSVWEQQLHSTLRAPHLLPRQLSYMFQHGSEKSRITRALEVGRPEFVELLVVLRDGMNTETITAAARVGAVDCMRYLQSHHYPFDETACAAAACNGHLDCLMYAHEHGYPWDERTTDMAGSCGHECILRYCIANECPYRADLIYMTIRSGCILCVRYLVEEAGFFIHLDVDGLLFGAAFESGNVECMRYLWDMGCNTHSYAFIRDCRNPSIAHAEWDARLLECIEFADGHGWVPNAEFIVYINRVGLFLCAHYLEVEGFL